MEGQTISKFRYYGDSQLEEFNIEDGTKIIEERAFADCKNLKKITIPDSVTEIGPSAFSNCENLTEIELPKNLKKIGYRAFGNCKRLKRLIIPEGVETIDWAAFAGCENIEEIVIPDSVTCLSKQLFLGCKKLKKVTLPSHIDSLPDSLFSGCVSLDITLNKNIKTIGKRCFENCYHLTAFPENVTSIGENCFYNCKNLNNVSLSKEIEKLEVGTFDGCLNLVNIESKSNKKITIGKRCFRNCTSLKKIPNFINNFNEQAFENCRNVEEIDIIDQTIPYACFRNCKKLRKINGEDKIIDMSSYAFSGCDSLEEVNYYPIERMPSNAFSNCRNLRKVYIHEGTKSIGESAFANCSNLKDLFLPISLIEISKRAFKGCKSLEELRIPALVKTIAPGAFSYTDSLKRIIVDSNNKSYSTSEDHKILINNMMQSIELFAQGDKEKSYSLESYNVTTNSDGIELIRPLSYINEYAFAGAKYLEELTLCACSQDIESNSFVDCNNLKKLNIKGISLFSCPGINIKEKRNFYFDSKDKEEASLPFEEISFIGDIVEIFPNALKYFKNVKRINLPKDNPFGIAHKAFSDCKELKEIEIPNNVTSIAQNVFPKGCKVKFENGIVDENLISLSNGNDLIGDYKLYTFNDYYLIEKDNEISTLTKDTIRSTCSFESLIEDKPIKFIYFINMLLKHDLVIKPLLNGILFSKMNEENLEVLLKNLKKEDTFFLKVLDISNFLNNNDAVTEYLLNNFQNVVDYVNLLKKYNIEDTILFNRLFMKYVDKNDFDYLLTDGKGILIRILNEGNLLKNNDDDLNNSILSNNLLKQFVEIIRKYNVKDRFLFNKQFIALANNPHFEKFISIYGPNTKRLLKMSGILDNENDARQNLNDLFSLLKITGAFDEDETIRQRAETFISEKIFSKLDSKGEKNKYRIWKDDIHRIFNFPYLVENKYNQEFDRNFSNFFIENYKELIEEEKKNSGFIQRVYLNFDEITKTSTSHKGSQRQLKVTVEKCINYLSKIKFNNVKESEIGLSKIIGRWYDTNEAWENAKIIRDESLYAPRNIFTKRTIKKGKIKYDNNPKNDLKESLREDFSYEWLPKQDYDNFILGKYCNCCAHLEGAGQGIMRASMISNDCQNLVIRNELGEIIAKSTIYVNRARGYAVFNNVETNLNYRNSNDLEKIYNAFIRGTKAFLNTYNKNNDIPLDSITIGDGRNTIKEILANHNHPNVIINKSLMFGEYALNKSYGYNGDWKDSQRLVLRRKG